MEETVKAVPQNTTVIICCAGMGTRLGIGATKALVDICGEPLIIKQLKLLEKYDDIRIVAGYQAERLIHTVLNYRKDIMFAFNYQYETTGVADSMRKALVGAREYVIIQDGDTLQHPIDFASFLACDHECIALTDMTSEEPVKAVVKDGNVIKLSKSEGTVQWPGMAKVLKNRLIGQSQHVYDVLNEIMPMKSLNLRTREIDTPEDYEQAIDWFSSGYSL